MNLGLADRVAFVTGASAGIGFAIAKELVAEGALVVLNARNPEKLNEAAAQLGPERVLAAPGDISDPDVLAKAIAAAAERFGKIDILVNNAGSAPGGGIDALSDDSWRGALDQKLIGYVRCAREVLPGMRQRRWGRIVNIIGFAGYQPRASYILGGALNAALLNFTKALSNETAPDNVLVNGVNPGNIRTARWIGLNEQRARLEGMSFDELEARIAAETPVRRIGKPQDIAGMVAFLCSERAGFITGALFDVDGGVRVGI